MKKMIVLLALATAVAAAPRAVIDLEHTNIIDLTHSFDEHTLYWPNSPGGFELKKLAYGPTPGGYFYSSFAFCAPEHGGTHLDAPIHFSATGKTIDQIPLSQLIAPAVVIDISSKTKTNADYRLTAADVKEWEAKNGAIAAGTIVLLNTGWAPRYGDRKAYFGDDTPGATDKLHFPSFGEDSAKLLVNERHVAAIGLDTPSIDYGPSTNFIVHQIAMGANVPGFENLMNLDQLPARGATVIALPMKIAGGSGGPLRIVALIGK
jgi:kynurenine formamidase